MKTTMAVNISIGISQAYYYIYTPTQHTSLSKLVVIKITSYALSFELHV